MKSADFKCESCGEYRTISVYKSEDFPASIPCLICSGTCKRIYTPVPYICHQGRVGNAANGYTSTGGNIKKTK